MIADIVISMIFGILYDAWVSGFWAPKASAEVVVFQGNNTVFGGLKRSKKWLKIAESLKKSTRHL